MPLLLKYLKKNGEAIFVEPIALSPALLRLRQLAPIARDTSPAEKQLTKSDLTFLLETLGDSRPTFFSLLGRFQRLLPNRNRIDKGHIFTKILLVALHGLDRIVLTLFPKLAHYSGCVVIKGKTRPPD